MIKMFEKAKTLGKCKTNNESMSSYQDLIVKYPHKVFYC